MPTEYLIMPEERKILIKNATIDLLHVMFLDKISFKSILDKLGVTRTSLYVYWKI